MLHNLSYMEMACYFHITEIKCNNDQKRKVETMENKKKLFKWWFDQYSHRGNKLYTRTGIVFADSYDEADKLTDSLWNDCACNFCMVEITETEGVVEI